MYWLIPVGIIGIGALLYSALDNSAGQKRKEWESKYRQVQDDVESHRKNIEAHLARAQASYDFYLLTSLHYSSMKVADEAYKLLSSSNEALDAIGDTLQKAKEKIAELKPIRDSASGTKRIEISQEIDSLYKLREALFPDKDILKAQRDNFLAEVKRLNNQTRTLKEAIRDRTGSKGKDWYERLSARVAEKRR